MSRQKKLRVVMVWHDFPTTSKSLDGGVQAAVFYLCSALLESGEIELEIIRPFAPPSMPEPFLFHGITVHPVHRPWWQPGGLHTHWLVRRQVRQLARQLSPDIVHVQNHAVIASALPGSNTVLTVHGIFEKDRLFRGKNRWLRSKGLGLIEKFARRKIRHLIAISPYVNQFFSGSKLRKIWQIANPVANTYFTIERDPCSRRIFSAAKISERKNVTALIKAFAKVHAKWPDAELRLAGSLEDDVYANLCRRLASDLGVGERVKFLGLLSVPQVVSELSSAACFALCSYQETAPLSIGEAMAAGVPVLASDICGVPFMVGNGVTGRLVDPHSQNEIEAGLFQMLQGDDLPLMGQRARQKALECYHASVVARQTIQAYREIMEGL